MSLSIYVVEQKGAKLNIYQPLHHKSKNSVSNGAVRKQWGTANSYFKQKVDTLHILSLYTLLSIDDFYEIVKE